MRNENLHPRARAFVGRPLLLGSKHNASRKRRGAFFQRGSYAVEPAMRLQEFLVEARLEQFLEGKEIDDAVDLLNVEDELANCSRIAFYVFLEIALRQARLQTPIVVRGPADSEGIRCAQRCARPADKSRHIAKRAPPARWIECGVVDVGDEQ
jgi:hypothetical protein